VGKRQRGKDLSAWGGDGGGSTQHGKETEGEEPSVGKRQRGKDPARERDRGGRKHRDKETEQIGKEEREGRKESGRRQRGKARGRRKPGRGRIRDWRSILYHLGVVLVSLLDCEGGLHLVLGELDHHPTEGGHRLGYLQAGQLPHLPNNNKNGNPPLILPNKTEYIDTVLYFHFLKL
jgi:hypothetical protein